MAEKKYLDLTGLGQYDAKIKALIDSKDAAKLAEAKAYADGLAGNYEAAGSVATAKTELEGKIGVVQGEVDALETLVGTLPEGAGVASVVAYVDKKTSGIATDAALAQLQSDLDAAEAAIDAIEADYLKAADKTALSEAITAEADRARGVEGGLETRLAAVEGDYLKGADKTELQGGIDDARAAAEAAQADIDAFMSAAEVGEAAVDTLKEIQAYITSDGEAAAQMTADIAANAAAIDAVEGRMDTAEGAIDAVEGRMDTAEADIDALQALFGDGDGTVADMIADAVAAEAELRVAGDEAAEASAAAALAAAQAADKKAVDAQGEVDALELVVAEKAAASDVTALTGRVATAEGKITTLEGASHTHSNKETLDAITAQLTAQWSEAYTKAHVHENIDVLNGINATLVANWNAAEQNAKTYAEGLVAEFTAITSEEVDGLFA